MTGGRLTCAWAVATVLFVNGCLVEPIEPGWFTPPAQKAMLFSPIQLGLAYEPVQFDAPGGRTIYGWFIPANGARASVLLNHGALFNRSALFGHYTVLHDQGCNVLVYDYQGFGESSGVASLDSLRPDADAALDYLRARSEPGTDRIILFGVSMGTLPTLAQAARAPDGVVGVILDGSFVLESLPPWTFPLFGVIPLRATIEKVAAQYAELDPHRYIGQITLPKLFVQSRQDLVTPFFGAQRLYELAPEPKQLIEVFGGHLLPTILDRHYAEHLGMFLSQVVGEPPRATR